MLVLHVCNIFLLSNKLAKSFFNFSIFLRLGKMVRYCEVNTILMDI